jgi:hypothetical protein
MEVVERGPGVPGVLGDKPSECDGPALLRRKVGGSLSVAFQLPNDLGSGKSGLGVTGAEVPLVGARVGVAGPNEVAGAASHS